MARINTNVPAVIAQRTLRQNQQSLQNSLQRLSSGLRINRGADDPAGLISSESLRAEIAGANKAISNSQRAVNIIATTEGALGEVASLLVDIQGLVVEAANTGGMSPEEIKANQSQIDSAIESITRISNTSTFAGRKLLDGSLDYTTSGVNTATAIANFAIHRATFGTSPTIPVKTVVTASAQKAQLTFSAAALTSDVSLAVQGNRGVTTLEFLAGTAASAILAAVNQTKDVTGVEAVANGAIASGVIFQSLEYGSDQFVSVTQLQGSSGTFNLVGGRTRATGVDAEALINGAKSIGRGLDIVLNTSTLEVALTLREGWNVVNNSTTFHVTGGGALFQLGPDVTPNQQVNIGVQSIAASRLGSANVGYLSQIRSNGDYAVDKGYTAEASGIINEAIRQVAVMRGRLGAFERNTLQTNINSLSITVENLTASESAIRDTDFAQETSTLTRNQILVNAGTSVLAMANSTPQSVLSLLQR